MEEKLESARSNEKAARLAQEKSEASQKNTMENFLFEQKEDRANDRKKFNSELSLLNQEMEVRNNVLARVLAQNKELRHEIETLKAVVTSSRRHFKNLETCNFEELQ